LLQQLREGDGSDDSDELQACSIRCRASATRVWTGGDGRRAVAGPGQGVHRVGQMARQLHDTLGQLGYHELLESTVSRHSGRQGPAQLRRQPDRAGRLPGTQCDRYCQPLQEELEAASVALADEVGCAVCQSDRRRGVQALAEETRSFLKQGLPAKTEATKAQLLEIMMAQDFQDLTGQVIKKIIRWRRNWRRN
jgi:chemotaxis protein CheZ